MVLNFNKKPAMVNRPKKKKKNLTEEKALCNIKARWLVSEKIFQLMNTSFPISWLFYNTDTVYVQDIKGKRIIVIVIIIQ